MSTLEPNDKQSKQEEQPSADALSSTDLSIAQSIYYEKDYLIEELTTYLGYAWRIDASLDPLYHLAQVALEIRDPNPESYHDIVVALGEQLSGSAPPPLVIEDMTTTLASVQSLICASCYNTFDGSALATNKPYYDYTYQFLRAREFSRSLGLECADFPFTDNRYLYNGITELVNKFVERVPYLLELGTKLQCTNFSQVLEVIVRELFQCNCEITIGYIATPRGPLFPNTQNSMRQMYADAQERPLTNVPYHAWLTLDSMEILDFSIFGTLAELGKRPKEEAQRLLFGNPNLIPFATEKLMTERHIGSFQYTPLVVGKSFIMKTSTIAAWMPFLDL